MALCLPAKVDQFSEMLSDTEFMFGVEHGQGIARWQEANYQNPVEKNFRAREIIVKTQFGASWIRQVSAQLTRIHLLLL